MSLQHRLSRWVAGGLISSTQAEQIAEFERERGRPLFPYAVAGLGALAVAVGLVSIVASNWDAIPGRVKVGIDLVLLAGLGLGVLRWHRHGPAWAREVSTLVLYALVLVSVALVGQVYQLGGRAHEALAVWTALTAVLMSRARSHPSAAIWLLGVQATHAAWVIWAARRPWFLDDYVLGTLAWGSLGAVALGRSTWLRRVRPAFARSFEGIGWTEWLLTATIATLAFYEDTRRDFTGLWVGALGALFLVGRIWVRLPPSPSGRAARVLLATAWVMTFAVPILSPGDLGVLAALSFALLWGLVAFTAHRSGRMLLLNLATGLIGIRIVIAYFEVFGSLLGTGLGLIIGGLLTIGVVWLWLRKRRDFERDLAGRTPA